MPSSDGKDQHRAGPPADEDPREVEERVERPDQQPADGEKQRGDGEKQRGDGEKQRGDGEKRRGDGEKRRADGERQRGDGDRRADGKVADAQHAPEQRGRERIEAPEAELTPAEHLRELEPDDHERAMQRRNREDPDVLLDIPILKVDEISLNVEELSAHVSVAARVGNLVLLNVGAEAHLGRLNLTIKGVEAKALLKVYLENVYAVLARTLATLDRNPELVARLLEPVGQAVASLGRTVEKTVPELGQSLGNTVEKTVPELGRSVGNTVEKTVPEVGKSVGNTVEKTVPEVGKSVGNTVEKTVPEVGKSVGNTVEKTVPEVGKVAGGALEKSRVMQPITRAAHRIANTTCRAGDVFHIRRRGAAMVRDVTRRLCQGALRR